MESGAALGRGSRAGATPAPACVTLPHTAFRARLTPRPALRVTLLLRVRAPTHAEWASAWLPGLAHTAPALMLRCSRSIACGVARWHRYRTEISSARCKRRRTDQRTNEACPRPTRNPTSHSADAPPAHASLRALMRPMLASRAASRSLLSAPNRSSSSRSSASSAARSDSCEPASLARRSASEATLDPAAIPAESALAAAP